MAEPARKELPKPQPKWVIYIEDRGDGDRWLVCECVVGQHSFRAATQIDEPDDLVLSTRTGPLVTSTAMHMRKKGWM